MKGGGNQQNDSSKDMLYVSAFFVILFGGMWFLYRPQVIQAVFSVRQVELNIILFFSDIFGFETQDAMQGLNQIIAIDPQYGTFADVVSVSQSVAVYLHYVLLALGIAGAVILTFFFEGSLYRTPKRTIRHSWPTS